MRHYLILLAAVCLLALPNGCLTTSGGADIDIRIANSGAVKLDGKRVSTGELHRALRGSGMPGDSLVLVRADDSVRYAIVSQVLDQVHAAGFRNVRLQVD